MDFLHFIYLHLPELLNKLWQQTYLVVISTSVATLIGVPLGMYLGRKPKASRLVLGCASIIQTIPSLALLSFLLPFLGIGSRPALVALTLYALLPILRNSLVAIQTIPNALQETSRSLGFSKWRQFYLVELPLSFPMIIAAIRIAVVMNIATATLAAFIGAGGLGDFINQGLALGNTGLLLLGAIPAALLAIVFDSFLGMIEAVFQVPPKCTKWWNSSFCKRIVVIIFVLLFIPFFIFLIISKNELRKGNLKIATKNFTEQIILGEIIAQLVEAKTEIPVERKFNLGSTQLCQAALLRGEIDLYPEYTGSAYLTVLNGTRKLSSRELYQYVSQAYAKQFHVLWLPILGFNNREGLAICSQDPQLKEVYTISDLVPLATHLRLGSPSEFLRRPDGIPGLNQAYQLFFEQVIEMDPGLMYKALQTGNVDVISAFSTDGRIHAYQLRLLQDDKQFFPSYDACLLVREKTLKLFPSLLPVLHLLDGEITDREMQQLNIFVDEEKKDPSIVAREFLKQKGLL